MQEKPPVFESWNSWYALVLGVMIVQVIFFFILTRSFS
jgi:hypothetical protein